MTRLLTATVALALVAAVALADTRDHPRVAVVLAGQAAERADLVSQVKRAGVDLRVPRSAADQLGTAHVLAADHYVTVLVVGADRARAVDPVAQRYPHTRFVMEPADPMVLQAALDAARP